MEAIINAIAQYGSWVILIILLYMFQKGEVISKATMDHIISETVAHIQTRYEQLMSEHKLTSHAEHEAIVKSIEHLGGGKKGGL